MKAIILSVSLFLLSGSFVRLPGADEEALPDFSGGVPGMELVREAKGETSVVYSYSTMLNVRDSRENIGRLMGEGWKSRKLGAEEMRLAAERGRKISGSVSILVYVNPSFPETEIRMMYLNPKGPAGVPDEALKKVVEISVVQVEEESSVD